MSIERQKDPLEGLFLTPKDLVKLGIVRSHSTLRNWREDFEGSPPYLALPGRRYIYPLGAFLSWLTKIHVPKVCGIDGVILERILELAHADVKRV